MCRKRARQKGAQRIVDSPAPRPAPTDAKLRLSWLPWLAAGVATALIVWLHWTNMRHAGALWRDEAAAVHLASQTTLREMWQKLEHESFPLFITMLLRTWSAAFGGNDQSFRSLGLLIGLCGVAALWWSARAVGARTPLLSLLLFGMSPVAIRWGDSLRAYGLGSVWILLVTAQAHRFLQTGSRRDALITGALAIAAVQTLYQNSFLLGAILGSGVVVAALRRQIRRALWLVACGAAAALTMIPYAGVIQRAGEWNVVTQVPLTFDRIGEVLQRAMSAPAPWMSYLWITAAIVAVISAVAPFLKKKISSRTERSIALYLCLVWIFATLAYLCFLKLARFPTEIWYYLPWIAISALVVEGLSAGIRQLRVGNLLVTLLAIAGAALVVPHTWKALQIRMTNIDAVAEALRFAADEDDLVVVHPWFYDASFSRYYEGRAKWTTLPPISDRGLQRLDLLKSAMRSEDAIAPVRQQMEETLRSGQTVWLAGYFPFSNPPQPPPDLPPAGEGPEGWRAEPYMVRYGMEVAYFLQMNAIETRPVELPSIGPVNPFENVPLRALRGWRERF